MLIFMHTRESVSTHYNFSVKASVMILIIKGKI